jgi:hypothetical protein
MTLGIGDSVLIGAREFPFLHSAHTISGAHPAASRVGTTAVSWWQIGWGVNLPILIPTKSPPTLPDHIAYLFKDLRMGITIPLPVIYLRYTKPP